jgi:hypothetical protein
MRKAERNCRILEGLKWFFFVPVLIMFFCTRMSVGNLVALFLGAIFGIAYFILCNRSKMLVICDDIVRDLRAALKSVGQENNIFEVKNFTLGFVVRVYLIRAKYLTPSCNKVIIEKIANSWYKKYIMVTQVTDIERESDLKIAQKAFNEALLKGLREQDKKEKTEKSEKK